MKAEISENLKNDGYCRTPAQGVRRDRIGTPQTKKAALTGSLYLVTQPDYRAILTLKFRVPSFAGLLSSVEFSRLRES